MREKLNFKSIKKAWLVLIMMGACIFFLGQRSQIEASDWNVGDVFAGIGSGSYNVFDNNGNFKETIDSGSGSIDTSGCAFNLDMTRLYTTHFGAMRVIAFDNAHPHNVLVNIDAAAQGGGGTESIVFAQNGEYYVGNADGNTDIQKYSAADVFLQNFNPTTGPRGTDWIDLDVDQRTMFYTSEGRIIRRFDVVSNAQLADFATLPGGGHSFALRLLPPGDGSAGLIVADSSNIKRLDGTGAVVQTYDAAGQNRWFSMNLDPNGRSFWAGDILTHDFFRFNIASGAIEVGPINAGPRLGGLCVKGEITAGTISNITLSPQTATNDVETNHTVVAEVLDENRVGQEGVTVTFRVISGPNAGVNGSDTTDVNGQASFTYTGNGGEGTDEIQACFTNDQGREVCSDIVTKVWEEAPTLVDLVSFTGKNVIGRVLLEWETASEVDNAGFNILRSESAPALNFVKINGEIIPGEGGGTFGATYSFIDSNVESGKTYYYQLEDVEFDGDSALHGPVSVTVEDNRRRLRDMIRNRE